jgi:hypothetical protein
MAVMGALADDHEDGQGLGEDYCLWDHLTEEEAAPLRRVIAEFGEALERSARLVEEEDREEIEHLEAAWRLPVTHHC